MPKSNCSCQSPTAPACHIQLHPPVTYNYKFLTKRSLTTIRSFLPRLFFAPSGAKNSLGRKDRPPHHYHSKCYIICEGAKYSPYCEQNKTV